MNISYFILILVVGVVGVIIGKYFFGQKENLMSQQTKKKQENKQKILEFLKENSKITNNNVEKLCDVSNATAERYLNELEKEGKLTQHGKIGRNVFYRLK